MSSPRPDLVALVPMRHQSERVPGKNYRLLRGRPLYSYVLDSLLACPEIDQVIVDTDSPTIRDGLAATHPRVHILERPEHLRGGDVPMNQVLLHDVSQIDADAYLQTHSTNPLVRPQTFRAAIRAYRDSTPRYDALFSVTSFRKRLWTADGKPVNHDPSKLQRTQDLPPLYEENSCIYIFGRDTFMQTGSRLGRRPALFEMDSAEALDIDDEWDFRVVEAVLANGVSGEGAV